MSFSICAVRSILHMAHACHEWRYRSLPSLCRIHRSFLNIQILPCPPVNVTDSPSQTTLMLIYAHIPFWDPSYELLTFCTIPGPDRVLWVFPLWYNAFTSVPICSVHTAHFFLLSEMFQIYTPSYYNTYPLLIHFWNSSWTTTLWT